MLESIEWSILWGWMSIMSKELLKKFFWNNSVGVNSISFRLMYHTLKEDEIKEVKKLLDDLGIEFRNYVVEYKGVKHYIIHINMNDSIHRFISKVKFDDGFKESVKYSFMNYRRVKNALW